MKYIYDHFGVPTEKKREGMIHFPDYLVWCSNYEQDLYLIEWIYFEKECKCIPSSKQLPRWFHCQRHPSGCEGKKDSLRTCEQSGLSYGIYRRGWSPH